MSPLPVCPQDVNDGEVSSLLKRIHGMHGIDDHIKDSLRGISVYYKLNANSSVHHSVVHSTTHTQASPSSLRF